MAKIRNPLRAPQLVASPATPPAGYSSLYFKDDGALYSKNPAGTEAPVGTPGPAGENNFVVEENGVYPARPTTEPVVFIGPDDPDALGLMLVGDTWIDTDYTGNTPTYALETHGHARGDVPGDLTNLVAGSDFEDVEKVPWDLAASSRFSLSTLQARSGVQSLRMTPGAVFERIPALTSVEAREGDRYWIRFWARADATYDSNSSTRLELLWDNGGLVGSHAFGVANFTTLGVWQEFTADITVPAIQAGATRIVPQIGASGTWTAGDVYVEDIEIRRMPPAREVAVVPSGSLTATDAQGAVEELDTITRKRNVPVIESPFLFYDNLYKSNVDDMLWRADRRWTVTNKVYRKSDDVFLRDVSLSDPFTDSYDSRNIIYGDEYQILEVDFGGAIPGYSYGFFYVNFYAGRPPENVTVEVYTEYVPHGGPGWINLNAVIEPNYASDKLWVAQNGTHQIRNLRIRIDGSTDPNNSNGETSLNRVEWHMTRPGLSNARPVVTKYGAETLFYDFRWKRGAGPLLEKPDGNALRLEINAEGLVGMEGVDTDWIAPTFANGWEDYGGSWNPAGYRRAGNRVWLRGLIRNGTVGSAAFWLPTGYQPLSSNLLGTVSSTSSGVYGAGRVDVSAAGAVIPATPSGSTWVALDGLSFTVD